MKKLTSTAVAGLAAAAFLSLAAVAAAPLAASAGVAALCVVLAVTWMAGVHAVLAGRVEERRVPVRARGTRAGDARAAGLRRRR